MKLAKAIFVTSTEAPGRNDRVAFLQSTQPERRDCYVAELWLGELGVMAGDELYPLHMFRRLTFRRLTVDSSLAASDELPSAAREAFVGAMGRDDAETETQRISAETVAMLNVAHKAKRRGRPPKPR